MVGASKPQNYNNKSKAPGRLTEKKKNDELAESLLKELGLPIGKVLFPHQRPPGDIGKKVLVDSNIYPVKLGQTQVYRYEVNIIGNRRNSHVEIEFTKKGGSSYVIADRMSNSREAFCLFQQRNIEFFGLEQVMYYDVQHVLFTLSPLNFSSKSQDRMFVNQQNRPSNSQANNSLSAKFVLNSSAFQNSRLPGNLESITMTVRQVNEGAHQFEFNDLRLLVAQETHDRSILSFIELAAKQFPIWNENDFITFGGPIIFFANGHTIGLPDKELDETKYLGSGVVKNALLMQGPKDGDGREVGLMVEFKYSPFYTVGTLFDHLRFNNGTASLYPYFVRGQLEAKDLILMDKIMRDIRLAIRYPDNSTRKIDKWSFNLRNANSQQIPELNMNVAQYYAEHHGKLNHPNAHLIAVKRGHNYNYYPPELLEIADNQSVNIGQMSARCQSEIIDKCAMRPDVLKERIQKAANAIQLFGNSYLNGANIQIERNTRKVQARILRAPLIQHKNGRLRIDPNGEAKWTTRPFLYPVECKSFAIYWIQESSTAQPLVSDRDINTFINRFQETARHLRMTIGQCKDKGAYAESEIESCVLHCKQNRIELCIFVTPENAVQIHENVKLYERRHGVPTQNLKSQTVDKINDSGMATVENFLAKTNMKLGGLNWKTHVENPLISTELDKTLFIGISFSQPGPKSSIDRIYGRNSDQVGIIGYAANFGCSERPTEFIGDYFYIEGYRFEMQGYLRDIACICTKAFCRARGDPPEKVVFYYNGLTKGSYERAYKYSISLIKYGIQEGNNNKSIPLTFIAVNKKNGLRLFPERFPTHENAQNHEYNVPYGLVIDHTIVDPTRPEFNLMPHTTPNGSANVPRYSILIDENNYTMNTIQQTTHVLCYEHQIDGVATSLPTPLMVADEYAQRGNDLFNAALREEEVAKSNPSKTDGRHLPRDNNGKLDLEKLSDFLNYSNTKFFNVRITA